MAKRNQKSSQFNMQSAAELDLGADDALLADLLGSPELSDEIVEPADDIGELAAEAAETDIEAALADAETDADAALAAVAAEIDNAAEVEALTPESQPALADAPADKPVKPKREKKTKAEKEPKEPSPLRNPFAKKSEKIAAKLGDKATEFLVLELADAELDAETLKAKQEAVLAEVDKLAIKVGEKAVMLFGWLRNGGSLNEIMRRTFTVLARDGELTSGDKGNLQSDFLAKPYSLGTARSQANQMFMLLPALKVCHKEKGRMVLNPDSMIAIKAFAELGITK